MNQKLYSALRLTLGIFMLLGIIETGSLLINSYRHAAAAITIRSIATLQNHPEPIRMVVHYYSQLIDSTQNHLS